jgi:hypothetical protein
MAEADGVILVFSPDVPGQDQQISDWFDFFVKRNGLKEDQCMIFVSLWFAFVCLALSICTSYVSMFRRSI